MKFQPTYYSIGVFSMVCIGCCVSDEPRGWISTVEEVQLEGIPPVPKSGNESSGSGFVSGGHYHGPAEEASLP